MLPGYQTFGLLVLTSFLLVIVTEAWTEYSDVDLRIAERRAIPHYIRHSYEYPDIDIKSIMIQRGLLPKSPSPVIPAPVRQIPVVVKQRNWPVRTRYNNRKYLDHSNHLEQPDSRYEKKYKFYTKYGNKTKKHRYT